MPTAEQMVREIRKASIDGGLPACDARQRASIQELKVQLWTLCLDMVGGLAARYTRNAPHLRDDFISDAYLKFEHVVQTFDPDQGVPFRGFLSCCVERHFHDKVRKRSEQCTCEVDDLPDAGPAIDARLRDEEIAGRVEAVLVTLLPRDRQRERKIMAFRLRHLEGWTVEQIRDWLGVKNGNTVSQWIHRVGKAFAVEFPRRFPEYFRDLPAGPTLDLDG
jgi:RNA polymerase sigma factor (sigma-70 family)